MIDKVMMMPDRSSKVSQQLRYEADVVLEPQVLEATTTYATVLAQMQHAAFRGRVLSCDLELKATYR